MPKVNGVNKGQALRNYVLNGYTEVWERGTSFTSSVGGQYTADRWHEFKNASAFAGSVSRQLETVDGISQFTLQVRRDNGNTNTGGHFLSQPMESEDSRRLRGKEVTLSFYARKGADYSPTNNNLRVELESGTGFDQGPLSALTGEVQIIDEDVQLNDAWTKYVLRATVPSDSSQLRLRFISQHTGTAGANDVYFITRVSLTEGTTAQNEFQRAGESQQGERELCARFYQTCRNPEFRGYTNNGNTRITYSCMLRTEMRATPTIASTSGNYVNVRSPQANFAVCTVVDTKNVRFTIESAATGLTSAEITGRLEAEL